MERYDELHSTFEISLPRERKVKNQKKMISRNKYYFLIVLTSILFGIFFISMFYLISKNSSLTKDITEISLMLQKTNLNYGEVKEKNVRLVEEKSKLNKEIDALKLFTSSLVSLVNRPPQSFIYKSSLISVLSG